MGVDAAGIGQQPDRRGRQAFRLKAEHRLRPGERRSIGGKPKKGYETRTKATHLSLEQPGPTLKLVLCQFSGHCRGTVDEIGQTDSEFEQARFLERRQNARSEAAGIQCRPESVAGPPKMMANRTRVKAW